MYVPPEDMDDATLIAHLRQRYSDEAVPCCSVCGGPLTLGRSGLTNLWVCAAMSTIPSPPGYTDEHYRRSQWEQVRIENPYVLEILRRYEAKAG